MNIGDVLRLLLEGYRCVDRGSYYELYHYNYDGFEIFTKISTSMINEMEDKGLVRIDTNNRDYCVIVL